TSISPEIPGLERLQQSRPSPGHWTCSVHATQPCENRRMFRRWIPLVLGIAAIAARGAEPPKAPVAGATASMDRRLAELKKSPPELFAFLYKMPKGGDLHNHLSGAIYAENFLAAAVEQHLCVDKVALALMPAPAQGGACPTGQVDAGQTQSDNTLRNALIDSFSMRNFV